MNKTARTTTDSIKIKPLKYRIVEIYEIWEYNTIKYEPENETGGLFSEYVNPFLTKNKSIANGLHGAIQDTRKTTTSASIPLVRGLN
mgnify:CR=1 FL=1